MIALGDCPVGIDLQLPETRGGKNRTREEQCLVLAGRWFHPEESCWIAGAADFQTEDGRCARKSLQQINSGTDIFSDVTGRFFQVWTGKEAYVKYTGSGIDRDFSRFSVMDPAFPAVLSWFAVRAEDREGREKNALLCVCTGEKAEIYVQ